MKKKVELPLIEPLYSTYHYQGPATAILLKNPSIKNWYLNQVMNLTCTRKFLRGFTSPQVDIEDSSWTVNPYLDKRWYNTQFLRGHTHYVIRNLIDEGFYVSLSGVDDYYVEGKSWYHERHFSHDGFICGYDRENKTYCMYSYDQNWIYRKFLTTQKSVEKGRQVRFKIRDFGNVCGIKPKADKIAFSAEIALNKIAEYLDSTMEKYPESEDGAVFGIVVHDYVAKYIDKLYDGSIPYEKIDRRVFRMIWEHKKVMLQRIQLIEKELSLSNEISNEYQAIVREADNARMLYASHHMKRRDAVLPIIKNKLLFIKEMELTLLSKLLFQAQGEGQK